MEQAPIKQSATLPYGYTATFQFELPDRLSVSWKPWEPVIKNARARRRFLTAYQAARAGFFQVVATAIGGRVAIADIGTGNNLDGVSVIDPETKH